MFHLTYDLRLINFWLCPRFRKSKHLLWRVELLALSVLGTRCGITLLPTRQRQQIVSPPGVTTLCHDTRRLNPLTPNDPYRGRTASLTSRRCILYIYSTNIGTEYSKNWYMLWVIFSSKCSLFHNSNVFGSCIIHILYIYSTNIGTEHFKHGIYSTLFFFLFKMQFVS